MIGNVWEWTSDWFEDNYYQKVKGEPLKNPKGPEKSSVSNNPYAIERVTRGGSFLCSDNYCRNYRRVPGEVLLMTAALLILGFEG